MIPLLIPILGTVIQGIIPGLIKHAEQEIGPANGPQKKGLVIDILNQGYIFLIDKGVIKENIRPICEAVKPFVFQMISDFIDKEVERLKAKKAI